MRRLIVAVAFAVIGNTAFAQDRGPAPQSGMEKPGMTDGAKPNGAMDTTGTSTSKGNVKRPQDQAPAATKTNEPQK